MVMVRVSLAQKLNLNLVTVIFRSSLRAVPEKSWLTLKLHDLFFPTNSLLKRRDKSSIKLACFDIVHVEVMTGIEAESSHNEERRGKKAAT